jgi:hypothetical protein
MPYFWRTVYAIDSIDRQTAFGLTPTPVDEALIATVKWWLEQRRAAA